MIGNQEALLSAIDYCDNELIFLFGSPLSCSYGDIIGIPSVKEMLTIIDGEVSKRPPTKEAFYAHINKYESDTERYQHAFDFLRLYTSPNTVNGIIRRATLNAFKEDVSQVNINDQIELKGLLEKHESWSIPPATQALAEVLSSSSRTSKIVLTPNFDPLLSIALNRLGETSTRTMLHGDSHIEQFHSDGINIVHFHGYWLDSDTLHTNAQLIEERPFLKQSLTRLLNKKTLIVIGYGGWNDTFTQALISLATDQGANFDILWSFYEPNQESIKNNYSDLLAAMKPALQRGRFKAFSGINCHEFLPKLSTIEQGNNKSEDQKNSDLNSKKHSNEVGLFTSNDVGIIPWTHYYEPAHNHIRRTERSYLIQALEDKKIINLSAEWGVGYKEFICTLSTTDIYAGAPVYRIELTGVKGRQDLHERIERETRCKLQLFIQRLPIKPHIIFFDGFDSSQNGISKNHILINELEDVISIITEFNQDSRILIASRKSLGGMFFPLELSKLEYFDAKEYIINHSGFSSLNNTKTIDAIIEISNGIPSRIDSCIRDSAYFSPEELYDEHFMPESYNLTSNADFQQEIVKRVELLASSQEQDQKRAYHLLEALSILEYGDTFSNLKRCNPRFSYNKQHIETLHNLELIEFDKINPDMLSTKNTEDEIKLIRLPAEVRTYVYRKLNLTTVNEISKNIACVHFGNEWRNGIFNFCKLNRQQLSAYTRVIGSSQTLLIQLLKCAIELNSIRDIEASFRACEHFCHQLYSTKKI
ncbi:SIR2 family protein [Aeromonas veronii]